MQRKYMSLFSDGNDFTRDPVFIFRPELRQKFMDRKLTEGEYCTLSHADLFRNASHAVDSLAREYGYRGHLLGKTQWLEHHLLGILGDVADGKMDVI